MHDPKRREFTVKVQNAEKAIVPDDKITKYLMNLVHIEGGPKARFFIGHGYTIADWWRLASDLLAHVQAHDVASSRRTVGGMSYAVIGEMALPDGATEMVMSVWYIADGDALPRLVTARPA